MTEPEVYILALLCSFFLFSCGPVYYKANTQNVPLLTEKGAFAANVTYADEEVNIQAAGAVSDHIGVMVNSAFFYAKESGFDKGGGSGQYYEAGVGYFTPSSSPDFVFETYGLLMLGKMENHFSDSQSPDTYGRVEAQMTRIGVQPAIGYKRKYFSAALSFRLAYLNFSSIRGDLIYHDRDHVRLLRDNKNHVFLEPALTLRGGFEPLKFQIQTGLTRNLTPSGFFHDPVFMTLGLFLNLSGADSGK